jgi:peptidyl-dipeptidase A
LVRRPEGRHQPDWAAKIHLGLYPAYYQNYLLGELTASQLKHAIVSRAGGLVDRREAGRFLVEDLFGRGAKSDWDTTLEQATGERLTPKYFVQEFVT